MVKKTKRIAGLSKATRLDRAIAWVSPHLGWRRMQARLRLHAGETLFRKYEGASKTDRLKNWSTVGTSANSVVQPALATLRNRVRYLVRNNPWAQRAIDLIESNVVGVGIVAQIQGDAGAAVPDVDDLWRAWADTMVCDSDGCNDFAGLQALVMRTVAESGECLLRRRFRRSRDGLPVSMQLQILEPDFLDSSKDRVLPKNGGRIIGGIEFDALGRRRQYWLFNEHPGENLVPRSFKSKPVLAKDILHVYRAKRPGQARGVPWGHAVITRLHDLDGFEDAQLVRQKLSACYMGFVRDIEAGADPEELDEEYGGDLEPGTWQGLPAGKDITFASPPPLQGYEGYVAQVLHAIAVGYGVSYEALTGDLRGVNFSSGRMGWLEFQRNIRAWQWRLLIPQFCRPAFRWFLEAAELAGAKTEGVTASWTPPRREMIDPTKEVPAMRDAIRSGLTTLPAAIRENGSDPAEVFEEAAATAELLDELGLVFDSDPRHGKAGSSSGGNSSNAQDGDDDKDDEDERDAGLRRNGSYASRRA